MYEIVTIIYGYPLTREVDDLISSYEDEEGPIEAANLGFETLYHGNLVEGQPGFLGVELYSWPAHDFMALSQIAIKPTDKQKAEVEKMVQEATQDFPEVAAAVFKDQPAVWFIPSSS